MGISDLLGLYRFRNPKTVDELAKIANTPEKVSDWVVNRVWYDKNEIDGMEDYWQTGDETLERKRGDCDDFAIIFRDAARKLGHKAQFLVVDGPQGVHAVTVFQENGSDDWKLFDCTNGIVKYKSKDIVDLLNKYEYSIRQEYPIDEDVPSKEYISTRDMLRNFGKGG